MLTRLKVKGFKNLVDVEVRFGPFTCIAGANGVGKSNLLDAISFLSALTDRNVVEAAMRVRDQDSPRGDYASIFHRYGSKQQRTMSFEADMIIPYTGTDDLGQEAIATTTFVRYKLCLKLKDDEHAHLGLPIEIVSEELTHIRAAERKLAIGFKVSESWQSSAVKGQRSAPNYISTDIDGKTILVHQDNGPGNKSGGRSRRLSASSLPRTVLSSANAAENPTASLARQEMRSWRLLQLEPTSLRRPDEFTAPMTMGADGSHLPATLWSLTRQANGQDSKKQEATIYATAGNRLAELLDDVKELRVDRDEKRDLLTLQVAGKDGTFHSAKSLSDGTLRFLALAVLELDPRSQGVLCMEEPENGIHPARIPAILSLLQDIAVDISRPISADNPLRQVIINTHSPAVVMQVPPDSLLIAETVNARADKGASYEKVIYSAIAGTWRAALGTTVVPNGNLVVYLNPVQRDEESILVTQPGEVRRMIDSPLFQGYLFDGTSA